MVEKEESHKRILEGKVKNCEIKIEHMAKDVKEDRQKVTEIIDQAQQLMEDLKLLTEKAQETKGEAADTKLSLNHQIGIASAKIKEMKDVQSKGVQNRTPSIQISDDESTKKDIVDQLLKKQGIQQQVELLAEQIMENSIQQTNSELQDTV